MSDESVGEEATVGRYQIVPFGDALIMLDTLTGETWKLRADAVEHGAKYAFSEWLPLARPKNAPIG
jgi:hypothetical protein